MLCHYSSEIQRSRWNTTTPSLIGRLSSPHKKAKVKRPGKDRRIERPKQLNKTPLLREFVSKSYRERRCIRGA